MTRQGDRITVELRLRDMASREMRQFERQVDRSASAASQDMRRLDRETRRAGAGFRRFALVAAGAFAAFEAARRSLGAGFGFVKAASDFEEAQSRFNVVFGETADRTRRELTAIADEVGRSAAAFVDSSSGFQTVLTSMGLTREAAAELSVGLTVLATDVASFNNAQDADVVRDFTSALVGNSETVLKYGANLKETAVQQEAYRLGIARVGEALTEQQKIQARVSLLTQATTDAQGDALRTSQSFENQTKRLNAAIGEIRVELGTKLIAAVQDAIQDLGGLDKVIKDVEAAFQFAAVVTLGFIRAGVSVVKIGRRIVDALGGPVEVLKALGEAVIIAETTFKLFALGVEINVRGIGSSFELLAELVGVSINKVIGGINEVTAGLNGLSGAAKAALDIDLGTIPEIPLIPGVEGQTIGGAFSDFADRGKGLTADVVDGLEQIGREALEAEAALSKLLAPTPNGPTDAEANGLIPSQQMVDGTFDAYRRLRTVAETVVGPGSVLTSGTREASGAFAEFAVRVVELGRDAFGQAVERGRVLGSTISGITEETRRYASSLSNFSLGSDLAAGVFGSLENGIDRLSRSLIEGRLKFKEFTRSLLADLAQIAARQFLLRGLRGFLGIGGTGGSTGGGLLGALGFEFANGGIGPGPMVASLPVNAYANGGIATSPQIGIFGEGRQNEAFVPLPDGKRIPVEDRGGGGGGITLNLNMTSLDPKSAADVFTAAIPQIQKQLAAALAGGQAREFQQAIAGG